MIRVSDLKDKTLGKVGTPKRDKYERELKLEIIAEQIKQFIEFHDACLLVVFHYAPDRVGIWRTVRVRVFLKRFSLPGTMTTRRYFDST